MRILKKILLILVILAVTQVAHASREIDLTDLYSGNSEVSHNHILIDKNNDTHHWKQCLICDTELDKKEHSITQRNLLGSSCSPQNKIMISCSGCTYTDEKPTGYTHVGQLLKLQYHEDGYATVLFEWCERCGETYASTSWGQKFTYADGTEVNPDDAYVGMYIYSPYGYGMGVRKINHIAVVKDYEYSPTLNGDNLTFTLKLNLPDYYLENCTDAMIINQNRNQISINGMVNGNLGSVYHGYTNPVLDRVNKTLTLTCTVSLSPITVNKDKHGTINLWNYWGVDTYSWELTFDKPIEFRFNTGDPVIQLSEFGV